MDPAVIALGLPVWIEATVPDDGAPLEKGQVFNHLLIAQDTGGAITGALRGDLFFGFGNDAEWKAGHMKNDARFFVLLPKAGTRP